MITVEYFCPDCGRERELAVRERGAKEDVCEWVEMVRREAGIDHMVISPLCRGTRCDLRIPLDAPIIGQAVKH